MVKFTSRSLKSIFSVLLSLTLCFASLQFSTFSVSDYSKSTGIQTYENTTSGDVVSYNDRAVLVKSSHTEGGKQSLRLNSPGYKPNSDISRVMLTNADNTPFTLASNTSYVLSAWIRANKSDGDTIKLKLMNTNDSLSYTDVATNILYEASNLSFEARQWTRVTVAFDVGTSLGRLALAISPNDENATDTRYYLIDDVSVVCSDLFSESFSALENAELYTEKTADEDEHPIAASSAVYTRDGMYFSAMRVFCEYPCVDGDYTKLQVSGVEYDIASRGIILADPETATDETAVLSDTAIYCETSGDALTSCRSYDSESGTVRYSVLIDGISHENASVCYAIRPYIKIDSACGEVVVYGDIQKGSDSKGFSTEKLYLDQNDGRLAWYPNGQSNAALYNPFSVKYSVVYPSSASFDVANAALDFRSKMQQICNVDVPVLQDSSADSGYEILIGETNRSLSASAYSGLADNQWAIRCSGDKIAIAGKNETALQNAIDDFFKQYLNNKQKTVPSSLNSVSSGEGKSIQISGSALSSFTIRTEQYPSTLTVMAAKSLQQFILRKTGALVSRTLAEAPKEIFLKVDGALSENEFSVSFSGTKVTVSGGSATAISAAVEKLKENLDNGITSDFSGSVSDGLSLTSDYALKWSDEFSGDSLDSSKWYSMDDTTAGPYYPATTNILDYTLSPDKYSYYYNSRSSNIWIKGKYVVSDILIDDGGVVGRQVGSYAFYDNISSDSKRDTLVGAIKLASGRVILSGDVPSGYAMEGVQTRPSVEGANFYLNNGKLTEVTKKSASGYDAVRLTSHQKMHYRYGFTEVRMKMATNNGACSSFWLSLNGNEIDVYENYGQDKYYSNIHTWSPEHINHVSNGDMSMVWVEPGAGEHFYDTWHHLGFEWSDSRITFYLDGEITNSIDITNPKFEVFRNFTALRLANGVGTGTYSSGYNPGNYNSDTSSFREEQEVDFVRVYQKADKLSKLINLR